MSEWDQVDLSLHILYKYDIYMFNMYNTTSATKYGYRQEKKLFFLLS